MIEVLPTRVVTFPRSGHHWLIELLQERLGDKIFLYTEHYTDGGKTLETGYPGVNVQKTHDFDLEVPKVSWYRHVVQVRRVQDCLKSWRKLEESRGPVPPRFEEQKTHFYGLWVSRWIVEDVPGRLIVRYEDLVKDTDRWLKTIIDHITTT